jgi:hypothetical protein
VATTAAETYLQHAVPEQEDVDTEEGLLHVGRLINCITQCNELEFKLAYEGDSELDRDRLRTCENELALLVNTLPDPQCLNEISLTCNPDVFLETLMGNIRNTLNSFQAWQKKVKNARCASITAELTSLKINFSWNADRIFRFGGWSHKGCGTFSKNQ